MRKITGFCLLAAVLLLSGCAPKKKFAFSQGTFENARWEGLEFNKADAEKFLQSYNKSCDSSVLTQRHCPVSSMREFQRHFKPVKLAGPGFMTGYYEPTLDGSLQQSRRFAYPVYAKPQDLYTIELASVYEDLEGYRLRGRIEGDKIVPYYDRRQINQNGIDADVICYVDDRVDAFFLQIQGSGKIKLQEGETINVGYADQNGHRYYSIGRYMLDQGYLETVSMQNIRAFLERHPHKIDEILHQNQSYVFFQKRQQGATGALGVELTPYASAAVDTAFVPLGLGMYIQSDAAGVKPLVVAQDVGGAIRGEGRVDYFFGPGHKAARRAGHMKEDIELFVFVPRDAE